MSPKCSLHACVCADGSYVPPMLLFAGNDTDTPCLGNSMGSGKVAAKFTRCGKQTQQSFRWWLDNVFIPHVNEKRAEGDWALVILDNHSSHTGTDTIRWLIRQKILIWFPVTNSTQFTMPLDVSVFGPLKQISAKIRNTEYDELKSYNDQVVALTMKMVEEAFTKRTITKGFIEAGYIRGDESPENIPPVKVEALLEHMKPLADLRQEMLEATEPYTLDHPILLPEVGQAILESRLRELKLEKLKRMYESCFRRGKTSIAKVSASSGEMADEVWAADIEKIENFAKEDKKQQKIAAEEAKNDRARKARERKEEKSEKHKEILKARHEMRDNNKLEIELRKKDSKNRLLELKLKSALKTIEKMKSTSKKRKKKDEPSPKSKKRKVAVSSG